MTVANAATATATATATYVGLYLLAGHAVDSTALAAFGEAMQMPTGRQYVSSHADATAGLRDAGPDLSNGSARSEAVSVLIGPNRSEDAVIAQIKEFEGLAEGWDGYYALKPNLEAVRQAIRFVRAAGDLAAQLDPTLHSDGSVILEVDGSSRGPLEFRGDGQVTFAVEGGIAGRAPFDSFAIPSEIRSVLGA